MMTGPQGGSWYPLGGAIQGIVEKNVAGTSMQVLPGAGISNVVGVQTGKAELGFGNAVSSVDGVNGQAPFKGKQDNVCQVATLYFQYFHAVALADSGVRKILALRIGGKVPEARAQAARARRQRFAHHVSRVRRASRLLVAEHHGLVALELHVVLRGGRQMPRQHHAGAGHSPQKSAACYNHGHPPSLRCLNGHSCQPL